MDAQRFDRIARALAAGQSRRNLARLAAGALGLAALGRAAAPAAALPAPNFCTWEGCACQQGQFDATGCNEGLTCCIGDGTTTVGVGVCTAHCGIQCIPPGRACTEGCPWYGYCYGCCSGTCENGFCTWA